MHITKHGNQWRFQIRIPSDLQQFIKRSILRKNLGSISKRDAKSRGRILAGFCQIRFTKLTVRATMGAKVPNSELSDFERDFERIAQSNDIIVEADKALKQLLRTEEEVERGIQKVISAFEHDLAQKEKTAGEEAFAKFQSLIPALRGPIEPDRPTFTHELPLWVIKRSKEKAVGQNARDGRKSACLDFVGHVGDKPLNHYKFSDFQKFADLLVRVPANYKKKPDLKDFSLTEVADFNDALPEPKRHETLVGKSILDNYLSPLKVFFQAMGVAHDFRSPLNDGVVRVSSAAREGVERSPLSVVDLNKWFVHAAAQTRSDEKWLPLLGTLTGARIGELINLQGKDILQIEIGEFVLDLTKGILERDGTTSKRKLKNKSSRRYIAVHERLVEIGFMEYARSRLPEEWIFPEAHRLGAAGRKNIRLMRQQTHE